MAQKNYIAVDLGAESGRVMAGRFDGGKIALEQFHRFPNGPVNLGGTLRWNLVSLWSEIQNGLREAASKLGGSAVSVGVDTWGVDFVLMNKNDELLGQPWNYRDKRTDGMMQKASSRVPRPEIFAETGLQFMQINSLYQLLAMCERDPGLVAEAKRFLMVPDFFHWCLSGSRVVEFTNATTTQMLNATTRDWAFDMLRKLEIPTDMFPEIVTPGTNLGTLRGEVAEFTGLGKLNVVTPATHDTGAAVAAVPTRRTGNPDWAYISSGTWSLMGVEVDNAVLTPKALEYNVTNEGGVDGTYRLLKNIMGLWLVQRCKVAFAALGKDIDYAELTRLATEAQPFRSLIDPDRAEFLSPPNMPKAIAEECRRTGQVIPETEGQFVRCALESLALKYRQVLSWMEELTGVRVEVIHIVGGGTQNQLLNQFTADACGRPVFAGPIEATALGNVLLQARAAGDISSLSEIREVVRSSETIGEYTPKDSAAWGDAWGRFQELVKV
ncbi:rhamnulokinase [Fuerstiella marisgermanici]|uniref:Rhamnulokinase n=1 Tax=Fuerstiella marisgermanici TaxID=1891926 RepID=A0A1P8WPX6_9PLAN|nr:rhamnulokinase [Fuerstiella marisgermanici]APZ96106.1 Rhamnulokinase [Fuerstiella marisgermanici]